MSAPLFIYLHGFLSSPGTHKAALLREHLHAQRADIELRVPALPDKPAAALLAAEAAIALARREHRAVALLGSSMGGFYATILAQRYGLRTVLINPAVQPHRLFSRYLGVQRNPYTIVEFELTATDLAALQAMSPTLTHPELFWLLQQQGDEVLDYRDAVNFYSGCRQTVEAGGNHRFENFERYLPEIVKFLECAPSGA